MTQGIALPNDLAKNLNHQKAQAMALQSLRIQIASGVYSHLIADSYRASVGSTLDQHERDAELYGNGDTGDDDLCEHGIPKKGVRVAVDIFSPATLAVQSADTLLMVLGLITPEMAQASMNEVRAIYERELSRARHGSSQSQSKSS